MTRSRTAERKKIREKAQRRQQIITIVAVVVGAIIVVGALLLVANQPAEAPLPEGTLTRYADLRQGRTEQGFPRLGEINARLQLEEYASFDCDNCAVFRDQAIDPLIEYIRAGDVGYTFVPIYSNQGNSQGAARAAICAAEQEKFWEMHETLYLWHGTYDTVQAFIDNRIDTGVAALGMDQGAFAGCVISGRPDDVLREAANRFQNLTGNDGDIPIFRINGIVPQENDGDVIRTASGILALIEETLAGQQPAVEETAEPTAAVTAEPATEAAETAEPTAEAAPETESAAPAEATAEATEASE